MDPAPDDAPARDDEELAIGRRLRRLGWISDDQLRQALQAQTVLGGRLGTCLLEMDALPEELLLRALTEQLSVPPARIADLQGIPREVIDVIRGATALELEVVPFRMLGDELYVATRDGGSPALQERLAEETRKAIRLHVGTEVRVLAALARYYDRPLSERYRQLERRLEEVELATHRSTAVGEQLFSVAEAEGTSADGEPDAHGVSRRTDAVSLGDLRRALRSASDPETVGGLLLDYLSRRFTRVLLLKVLSGEAVGWKSSHGAGKAELAGIVVDLGEPSVLRDLAAGRPFHFGPLQPSEAHRRLGRQLRGQLPTECFVLPVRIRRRLVLAIFCEPGPGGIDAIDIDEMRTVAQSTADALERCILERKRRREARSGEGGALTGSGTEATLTPSPHQESP